MYHKYTEADKYFCQITPENDNNFSSKRQETNSMYPSDSHNMQIRYSGRSGRPRKLQMRSFVLCESPAFRSTTGKYIYSTNSWKLIAFSCGFLIFLCFLSNCALAEISKIDNHNVTMSMDYEAMEVDASTTPHYDDAIFASTNSEKKILDELLRNSNYDKRIIPPMQGKVNVNVSVLLLSLASPDESSLKYEVEFLLNQEWVDPRLSYGNNSKYEYLNAIHHYEDIWLPDTYFTMHGDFKHPLIPMHFSLKIHRNGTITYAMRKHLIISCNGILEIFPFDDPVCVFSLESISYDLHSLEYHWKNGDITLRQSPSIKTLNAHLIQNKTLLCDIKDIWRHDYSCLRVQLTFARDRAFYFTTVFIPGIILVTSSFVSFWLEWNSVPARAMIGVTTMLNFFTSSNSFRGKLPVVSSLTAMNVWDGACMCFIYISLLEFICVNYVGRKRPLCNPTYMSGEKSLKRGLPKILRRIKGVLSMPLETIEQEFLAATSPESQYFSKFRRGTTPRSGTPSPRLRSRKKNGGVSPSPSVIFDNSGNITPDTPQIILTPSMFLDVNNSNIEDVECGSEPPIRPPRTKTSRERKEESEIIRNADERTSQKLDSEKLKINFEKMKKNEPPHPIRVAKTIDVIARMVFPSAYAIFLIYFFIHYNVGKHWSVG